MRDCLKIYEDKEGHRHFDYYFPSISSFVKYTREAPINDKIFTRFKRASESTLLAYGTDTLEETFDHLINGYHTQYPEYRRMSQIKNISFYRPIEEINETTVLSYDGGYVDINAYLAGEAKCMRKTVYQETRSFINFYIQLLLSSDVTEKENINRGIIALEIIRELELSGVSVNIIGIAGLEAKNDDYIEEMLVKIILKSANMPFNESKCIGPLTRVEFPRRAIMRLIEATPFDMKVAKHLQSSYGRAKEFDEIKPTLPLKKGDIYLGNPRLLGIRPGYTIERKDRFKKESEPMRYMIHGKDIYEDFETTLECLKLKDVIKLKKRLK